MKLAFARVEVYGAAGDSKKKYKLPPRLARAFCPNTADCGDYRFDSFWFDQYEKISYERKAYHYIDSPDEQCSFWVKPPYQQEKQQQGSLDFIDVSIKSYDSGQVVVYVIAEGPDGEIEFMEGQEVHLESDYVYQFMLQYQQDIDINESYGAYIAGRTPAEMKMKAEFLTIEKEFYASQEYLTKIGERIEREIDKPYKGYYDSEYPDINTHCYKPEGMDAATAQELFAKKKTDGKCKSRAFQTTQQINTGKPANS